MTRAIFNRLRLYIEIYNDIFFPVQNFSHMTHLVNRNFYGKKTAAVVARTLLLSIKKSPLCFTGEMGFEWPRMHKVCDFLFLGELRL